MILNASVRDVEAALLHPLSEGDLLLRGRFCRLVSTGIGLLEPYHLVIPCTASHLQNPDGWLGILQCAVPSLIKVVEDVFDLQKYK